MVRQAGGAEVGTLRSIISSISVLVYSQQRPLQ